MLDVLDQGFDLVDNARMVRIYQLGGEGKEKADHCGTAVDDFRVPRKSLWYFLGFRLEWCIHSDGTGTATRHWGADLAGGELSDAEGRGSRSDTQNGYAGDKGSVRRHCAQRCGVYAGMRKNACEWLRWNASTVVHLPIHEEYRGVQVVFIYCAEELGTTRNRSLWMKCLTAEK